MIETIHIENFKNLKRVDIKLGPMNILIGPNASGKSNFFDALRVLQGIGNGFTFSEILDGKPRSSTIEKWGGVRGGRQYAAFDSSVPISFAVSGFAEKLRPHFNYELSFLADNKPRLENEKLTLGGSSYQTSDRQDLNININYFPLEKRLVKLLVDVSRPALSQIAHDKLFYLGPPNPFDITEQIEADRNRFLKLSSMFANIQRFDPIPSVLREYGQSDTIQRIGERGENFASLIKLICESGELKQNYLSWLQELRPEEFEDVGTLSGAVGEPLFSLTEQGRIMPANTLSDGTLRFAAIAAAFFQPDMPDILTIEEIENGIHPNRLRLLVELMRKRSSDTGVQTFVTTHSPLLLAWLTEEEYEHTFFCHRDPDTLASEIRPLSEIPHFREIVKNQSISELLSEGWMEAVL